MADLRLKRGATLRLSITALHDDSSVYDLTGVTVAAMLRDAGDALVATLPVVNGGASGLITIVEPATAAWPLGTLRGDIRLTTGPEVVITDTFTLRVELPVTR